MTISVGQSLTAEIFPRKWLSIFERSLKEVGQNLNNMKTPKLLTIAAVSAGLAFGVVQAKEKKHEEENVSASDVPAAVTQAAEKEAKGGKIVRWEKEGANFEAVIEKSGKEWGYKFDANGKMLGKHSEASEKGEKGEKGEKY